MRQKFVVLTFILATCAVFVPSRTHAGTAGSSLNVAARNSAIVQPKHKFKGNRGRHLGWYKGRRAYWYSYNPYDPRFVRRVYYIDRRPIVRWVWVF